jgi:hypothetical protein
MAVKLASCSAPCLRIISSTTFAAPRDIEASFCQNVGMLLSVRSTARLKTAKLCTCWPCWRSEKCVLASSISSIPRRTR